MSVPDDFDHDRLIGELTAQPSIGRRREDVRAHTLMTAIIVVVIIVR